MIHRQIVMFIIELPGLVNVYILQWKDPPCYYWENPLFLWPFSIAFGMFTRGYIVRNGSSILLHTITIANYIFSVIFPRGNSGLADQTPS